VAQDSEHLTAYDPRDRTHRQITPEAYEIVTSNGGVIAPGRRDDLTPAFRGLPNSWWQKLHDTNPQAFVKLVSICRRDFPTFCALMAKIVNRLDMSKTPFIFNNGQQVIWNRKVMRRRQGLMIFFLILKARQLGITCFDAAEHFWELWRGENIRTLDTTHDEPLAVRIISFFRIFYDNLPIVKDVNGEIIKAIKPPTRSDSKTAKIPKKELYFSDRMCEGATYVAKNLDPRGFTSQHIGLHECAFYPNLKDFWQALSPQLPAMGTKARLKCSVTWESTPNGQNDFYDFWNLAKNPESEMTAIFLPWYIHDDEYTMEPPSEWRMDDEEKALQAQLSLQRQKIDGKKVTRAQMYWRHRKLIDLDGDEDALDMEFPSDDQTCFLQRSESVFSADMKYLTRSCAEADVRAKEMWAKRNDTDGNPIETLGPVCGKLRYKPMISPFSPMMSFHEIERPKFAIGESGDLYVWEPPEKGHLYIAAADTAGGEQGRDLSTCVIIDLVSGNQVAEFAGTIAPIDFADDLVHLCEWYNKCMILPEINGLGSVVLKRMSEWGFTNFAYEEQWDEIGVKKNKPGFQTKPSNRPMIFSTLQWFVQERYFKPASRDLVREMSTFKRDGMEYRTAKKHQHDDRVVAAGLACIAIRQAPKYLMMIEKARRDRIPTAVDLGLSHSPSFEAKEQNLRNRADDETIEKAFGKNNAIEFPWNAIRGFDVGDWA
jgi:hypothetical protein